METVYSDSHAHLSDEAFSSDREAVISRAISAGVELIVEVGCEVSAWESALSLCRSRPENFVCALGLHPHNCGELNAANLAALKKLLPEPQVIAVGEIGLDYARSTFPRQKQLEVLAELLKLASSAGKPVIFHCRSSFDGKLNAYADLFASIKTCWTPPSGKFSGILHCFSGDGADAGSAAEAGLLLGVNGTVTYPKNDGLREIFRRAGAGRLVLETDCPYLPPQSARGKRNEPSAIPEICRALAETLGIAPEAAAETSFQNLRSFC